MRTYNQVLINVESGAIENVKDYYRKYKYIYISNIYGTWLPELMNIKEIHKKA
jgi:hypothetical protein